MQSGDVEPSEIGSFSTTGTLRTSEWLPYKRGLVGVICDGKLGWEDTPDYTCNPNLTRH